MAGTSTSSVGGTSTTGLDSTMQQAIAEMQKLSDQQIKFSIAMTEKKQDLDAGKQISNQ